MPAPLRHPAALLLTLIALLCGTRSAAADDRPNILFLFTDDQSFETIRAFGDDPQIQTPAMDSLVARGTTFRRCYNMGSWSGAVCVASRTMLNTGRFLWNAHKVYDQSEHERQAGRWWSEHLKRAGYRTYMTGKWHCRANAQKSFDRTGHVRGGMPKDSPEAYNRPLSGQPDPWSPSDPRFGGYWQGGRHWSEVVADDAIDFLHDATARHEPFFMYVAFNAPHDPRQAPQEYVDRYPADSMAIPRNFLPEYPHKELMGAGVALRDEKLAPFPRTHHAVQVHRQEYYALITHLDDQIARILSTLEGSGKADNTWIFLTSDHGLAVGHHGLFGKQNMYEHSVRVPFVVVGPGVDSGRSLSTPIYLQDVMPTTLALAGVEPPSHVDFQNLLPILRGERQSRYDAVYGAYLDRQRMITRDGWKLILYPQGSVIRLYHLDSDPLESHDRAGEPDQQPRIRSLFRELRNLQQQMGDDLDLKQAYPHLAG